MDSYKEFLNEVLITFNNQAYPKFNNIVILAGGAGCFGPNTLVKTEQGHKKISEVKEGDKVWSFNPETSEKSFQPVYRIIEKDWDDDVLEVEMEDGEKFIVTETHEFFIDGKFIQAKEFVKIDNVGIKSYQTKKYTDKVYDLSVDNNSTYFISSKDIPVHNSGKGFIKDKLLGIEGKTLDVDSLKSFLINSKVTNRKLFGRTGRLDLRNPEDVYLLHSIAKYVGIEDQVKKALEAGVDPESIRKPNLIFDVTLKDFDKLREISGIATAMGYDMKNIHLVWVVNDLETAMSQNATRSRVVPEEILKGTHKGVAVTMANILSGKFKLDKQMDGDVYLAFNRKGIDTSYAASAMGGGYLEKADYIKFKKAGKKIDTSKLTDDLKNVLNTITSTRFFK